MTVDNEEAKAILMDLPTAIIRWYPFKKNKRLLLIGDSGAMDAMLQRSFYLSVEVVELDNLGKMTGPFDYVVCIRCLELASSPVDILVKIRKLLDKDGILLLGMNNRLGVRYLCGDYDPYTKSSFDSIDNYCRAVDFPGRMYAKSEIETMLVEAGLDNYKTYSVLPRLEEATFIFAEGQLPKEDLTNRLFPSYNHPQALLMEEEPLYRVLMDNGMFHSMANAYLIECSLEGDFADVLYVTSSLDRGKENAMLTVIHGNGSVSKEAAYSEGVKRLECLNSNIEALQNNGVPVVRGHFDTDNIYTMPYIDSATAQIYLKKLLFEDKGAFLAAMDVFSEAIRSSSPSYVGTFVDAQGNIGQTELFEQAYLDMVPLNSFYIDGKFVFFDQEFLEEDYPVNVVLTRMIATFYAGIDGPKMEEIIPADDLYERYGLLEEKQRWLEMEWSFLQKIRQEVPLLEYNKKVRRGWGTVSANRRRMNYPEYEFRRVFLNIFQNVDSKQLIIFGSGKYARAFMDLYHVRYPVYAIIDNNENTWGQKLHDVVVQSPEILKNLKWGEFKVIICIKQFYSAMEQLDAMGIVDYSVFDPVKNYASPKNPTFGVVGGPTKESGKKFHVGYVAGVFDLFHYGHLNVLRRAKEQCDYLIVGVVSDRQVREKKKVEPFVPFGERLEIVRSCRYVDEAHEIPFEHPDTDMAWKLYHFDVQFSGSDYEHDPVWLRKKEWLEERGSTMVFFPYTQSTSSTRLKKLIMERLI